MNPVWDKLLLEVRHVILRIIMLLIKPSPWLDAFITHLDAGIIPQENREPEDQVQPALSKPEIIFF